MIIQKNTFYAKVTSTKNQLIDWRPAKTDFNMSIFFKTRTIRKRVKNTFTMNFSLPFEIQFFFYILTRKVSELIRLLLIKF